MIDGVHRLDQTNKVTNKSVIALVIFANQY